MTELKINGNYLRLFIIASSVFTFYLLLLFTILFFLSPIFKKFGFGLADHVGFLVALNTLTSQNNLIVYMLVIYTIYHRLSLLNINVQKLESDQLKSDSEVVTDLKKIAGIIDKICGTLDILKISYSISNFIYVIHFTAFPFSLSTA